MCVWRGVGPVQEIVCIHVLTRNRSQNQDRKLRSNSAKLLAIVMFVHQGGAAAACKVTGLQGLTAAQPWADSYRTGPGRGSAAVGTRGKGGWHQQETRQSGVAESFRSLRSFHGFDV